MLTRILSILSILAIVVNASAQNNSPDTKVRLKIANVKSYDPQQPGLVMASNNYMSPDFILEFDVVAGGELGEQRLESADFILKWDPTKLQLLDCNPVLDSRINQTVSCISSDSVSNGVNDTFADGNGMFHVEKNPTWTGTPAIQLSALTGTWLTNDLGTRLCTFRFICVAGDAFSTQTTPVSIEHSVQIPGYPLAQTVLLGCNPVVNVTGNTFLGKTIVGIPSPLWKFDMGFENNYTYVRPGQFIEVPIFVEAAEPGRQQRFINSEFVFSWNPKHLRVVDISFETAPAEIWRAQSGFGYCPPEQSTGCIDFNHINESIPPQDGTGYVVVYGSLGSTLIIDERVHTGVLTFEVLSQFDSTVVEMVPTYQGDLSVVESRVMGSYQPGRDITDTLVSLVLVGAVPGDINGDGTVGAADMTLLLAAWGQASYAENPCDINGDGMVDSIDLSILMNNWQ